MVDSDNTAGLLCARLDRIPNWSLPRLFALIIGIGFLFTFYDIFDINVSFIQTCSALVPGCTPQTSVAYIGLPVLLNLVGYVVGTIVLSPLSDRMGRRDLLLITMIITGIGSTLTAFVHSYDQFVWARILTGVGIGADLSIVNTYITELAPKGGRARYTAMIFIFSALGGMAGVWLGLWLCTPATPLPLGLPFALASQDFTYGWRIMYLIGGVLALVGVLLRFQLPESPRWLITKSRFEEAAQVISDMEARAHAIFPLPPVPENPPPMPPANETMPFSAIFKNPVYRNRTLLLVVVWFLGYVTVYSFAAGFTSLLSAQKYPPPEAGLITAVGTLGFLLCAIVTYAYGERMERKRWTIVAIICTVVGSVIVALGGQDLWVSLIGSIIVFFGFNVWVPMAYAWSVESYPTRARTTGFALVDGIGHLGGGVGMVAIAPLIPHMHVLTAFLVVSGFLLVAAVIAQFGINTRNKILEDVSP